MIGISEIIFAIIVFIALWFAIFKFILIYQSNNILKNIEEKIDKQNKRFFMDGKEVDLKKQIGISSNSVTSPGKKKAITKKENPSLVTWIKEIITRK